MAPRLIHVKDGTLADPTTPAEVARLLGDAWDTSSTKHLVVHFHGGLIGHKTGLGIADKLAPVYEGTSAKLSDKTPTNASPCFFIWDSGILETITHNLPDIAKDPLFRKMVGKVARWVLGKVTGGVGLKGAGGGPVDADELERQLDAYFADPTLPTPALLDVVGESLRTGDQVAVRSLADDLDEDRLTEEIQRTDLEADFDFQDVVQGVANGLDTVDASGAPKQKGVGIAASTASPISAEGADRLFGPQTPATRGVVSLLKVARAIAEIVIRVIRRFHQHRDHGPYITISEEVLRQLYVGDAAGLLWNQMKKDTADAFDTPASGGSVFLQTLKAMAAEAPPRAFNRITLVGHSTGAVFICNMIDAAVRDGLGRTFEVIFLAPAVRHTRFAQTLNVNGGFIDEFRQFAMHNDLEGKDSIVPVVYPHSLLYFVSGLLEYTNTADALVDEPIVGMERYIITIPPFSPKDFPEVDTVRQYLNQPSADRIVWSDALNGPGMSSLSHHHGDFDDDPTTLDSLATILRTGF